MRGRDVGAYALFPTEYGHIPTTFHTSYKDVNEPAFRFMTYAVSRSLMWHWVFYLPLTTISLYDSFQFFFSFLYEITWAIHAGKFLVYRHLDIPDSNPLPGPRIVSIVCRIHLRLDSGWYGMSYLEFENMFTVQPPFTWGICMHVLPDRLAIFQVGTC